jgi:DNA-binding CsgD family transcriptional regulator
MKLQDQREAGDARNVIPAPHGQVLAQVALEAVLESATAELYVVSEDGRLMHASPSARTRFAALSEVGGPEPLMAQLPGAKLRWLPAVDGIRYALLRRPEESDAEGPLARVREEWKLTRRQVEVLQLLAQGHSNREIAQALSCSERTVELHIASLFRKASCESRTALVAKFWR